MRFRFTAVLAFVVACALLAAALPSIVLAQNTTLQVSVEGSYANGPASPNLVAGVVNGDDFVFRAVCTGSACADATYQWVIPGAANVSSSPQVSTPVTSAGSREVRVLVTSGQVSAQASMTAIASVPLVDPQGQPVSSDLAWAAVGSGMLPGCGSYTPRNADGSFNTEDPNFGSRMWCDTPTGPDVSSAGFPTNGVDTGVLCTQFPSLCGADAAVASTVQALPVGELGCTGELCQERVKRSLTNEAGLRFASEPVCEDNIVVRERRDEAGTLLGFETVRGTEPGCASVQDAARALLAATDAQVRPVDPPKAALVTNSAVSPEPTDLAGWDTSGTVNFEQVDDSANGGSSNALKVPGSSTTDQELIILANTVPGETYTFAVNVRAAKSPTLGLELTGQDADGAWITSELMNSSPVAASADSQFQQVYLTGIAPAAVSGLRVSIPAGSGQVFFSEAMVTSTLTPQAFLPPDSPVPARVCQFGPEPSQAVLRAARLNPAVPLCDTDAALTKQRAAELLSWLSAASQSSSGNMSFFRDSSSFDTTAWKRLASLGVPVTGDLSCPDVTAVGLAAGVCANTWQALTYEQFAAMVRPLTVRAVAEPGSVEASALLAAETTRGLSAVPVSVFAQLPADAAAGEPVNASVSSGECVRSTVPAGLDDRAVFVCYVPSAPGPQDVQTDVSASVSVSVADGSSAVAPVSATARSTAPLIADMTSQAVYSGLEDDVQDVNVYAVDVDASAVTAQVRSCLPSVLGDRCVTSGAQFEQTGQTRTDVFADEAFVETGTVRVASVADGVVSVQLTPFEETIAPALPDPLAKPTDAVTGTFSNGPWQFELQTCDESGLCSTSLVNGETLAQKDGIVFVNDLVSGSGNFFDLVPFCFTVAGAPELTESACAFADKQITIIDLDAGRPLLPDDYAPPAQIRWNQTPFASGYLNDITTGFTNVYDGDVLPLDSLLEFEPYAFCDDSVDPVSVDVLTQDGALLGSGVIGFQDNDPYCF